MRRIGIAAAVGVLASCGLGLRAAGDDGPAAAGGELAKFQGTWRLVSAESDGVRTPEETVRKITVTIRGNTHTVRLGDRVLAHDVGFAIDPTTSPKSVTDTIAEGPQKGQQIRGIYELDGDTLRSCVAAPGAERPTRFAAGAGSGHTLRVFKKVPDDKEARMKAIAEELKRFEGTWVYESSIASGVKLPEAALKGSTLILKGDRFEMKDALATYRGVLAVDPTADPKTLDITFDEGPEKGKSIQGIYKLEGDTYTNCVPLGPKDRPKEFSSEPGSGQAVSVLKRVKE
jgi:uncharacterized protein (TIGR03067 family)